MSLERGNDPETESKHHSLSMSEPGKKSYLGIKKKSSIFNSGARVSSLLRLRSLADLSKINFMYSQQQDTLASRQTLIRGQSIVPEASYHNFFTVQLGTGSDQDLFPEQFPINVTRLLNEDQLWGCFFTFPELYADMFSPIVHLRKIEDVPEIVGGVLTRDMITACLSYLKRTPILGDYVYIKLDLSSKHLKNIDVLQHYKYLVYLDLSSNYLTELTVLSHLLYLQYLSVAFNRLSTVLEYETPQWYLTEVHYQYNSVKRIRDISMFWSITVLDLSHNNIKCISGLENMRYLRRLDLSFNHIQHLENLNNLRLLWLDVSYNNISSFEFSFETGLWTLPHLEYLNLNENNLTSMKIFSGCTRLRELHARNNRLSTLLELAVYMRQMRRLIILDLRANPICSIPGYKDVIINTFPVLLSLDATELDPVDQRTSKMGMAPDVDIYATRRLSRLLYIEQLARAGVSQYIPPADTTEVPLVILVGYEAVGKGTHSLNGRTLIGSLARRLAAELSHVELALQHTTAPYHFAGHYKEVNRLQFDNMLLDGEFLTYSEMDGESYGLSREEGFINEGKVKIVTMDLIGALMMKNRGRRPYLILATCMDKILLAERQEERKLIRNTMHVKQQSMDVPMEKSTLQVLISGRILITGILNEILMGFPDEKDQSEFVIESQCSLLMDSEARQAVQDFAKGFNMITLLGSSGSSLEEVCDRVYNKWGQNEGSLCSLYKESQNTDEYASDVNGHDSYQSKKSGDKDRPSQSKPEKLSNLSRPKSVDFSRYVSSTWKGMSGMNSTKSSKSVTFTSQDAEAQAEQRGIAASNQLIKSGMLIEEPTPLPQEISLPEVPGAPGAKGRSLSTRLPWPQGRGPHRTSSGTSFDDLDLWLAFLVETGLMRASDGNVEFPPGNDSQEMRQDTRVDDPDFIIRQLEFYAKIPTQWTYTTNIRDEYESIHRKSPGLFWDTVTMDNQDEAFRKMKGILRRIVESQKNLRPMFDIDFANLPNYPTVEKKMAKIQKQIAPRRLFH